MTVTAIQIGLDPDVIDYSSADFAQFPGISKKKLRAANDKNVAQPGCRFDSIVQPSPPPMTSVVGTRTPRRWLDDRP
jgi:hypothetical protein